MGVVDVKHSGEHELTLEWDSGASSDMIADSTLALITGIDKSPASVKRACQTYHPFLSLTTIRFRRSYDPSMLASAPSC